MIPNGAYQEGIHRLNYIQVVAITVTFGIMSPPAGPLFWNYQISRCRIHWYLFRPEEKGSLLGDMNHTVFPFLSDFLDQQCASNPGNSREPAAHSSIFLRSPTRSTGSALWTIRWQFEHKGTRSAAGSTSFQSLIDACGFLQWISMYPSPYLP